jgi:small basic protein (TIGR04137 family)
VSIDKSLRRKGGLARTRNVLKRDERVAQMQNDEKWVEGRSAYGIPKTRVMKLAIGKKKKKKDEEEGAPAKGAPGKGAPAKGAPGKAAAPAKGAPAKGAPAKAAPAKGAPKK